MKIVVNKQIGGYRLSPLALKRIGELNNKPCYFFTTEFENGRFIKTLIHIDDIEEYRSLFTYSVEDPDNHEEDNDDIRIDNYSEDRSNPILVQVVEELGDLANTPGSELEIIEIPDDVKWYIYESECGIESIHEEHRVW